MAQKNAVVDDINKRLLALHGTNNFGNPNFRVVLSSDQYESRKGTYDEYSGKIFLRTFKGVREVPKYAYLNKQGRWILERWAGPELTYHPDIVSALNGDYVCVYVFQDRNLNYLPPLWKVIEIVMKHLLHPRDRATALLEDYELEQKMDRDEYNGILNDIKERHERNATSAETLSISAFVEPSKQKI